MTIETKKVASANEAIAIIDRLNYRHDTFQYRFTTREDNADIKYRHFDAYKANGEKDGFAMIEIVVNGKLEVVRFFNHFRNITVDLKLGDFTPDYSRFDNVIDVDAEVATVEEADPADYAISNEAMTVAVEAEIKATTVEKFFKAIEEVKYFRNSAGAKIWHVKSGFDWKRVSKVHAARWLAEYGLTMDEFFSIENYLIEEDRRKVVEYDRNEIMSTPLVSEEAQEVAINAEIEQANAPTEDNDYDETDEPEILNADLFVNLYHSPMQERYASVTRTINGEQLHFFHHRLTHISAPALDMEVYFDKGRMDFWHGSKRIARDKVWQVPIIKETAKAQAESFGKFFADDHTPKFFKVSVYSTFADGSEHDYVRYFDFFNQAQAFVEEVKNFVGDVLNQIYITHDSNYFYTRVNGTEHYTLPAVDAAQAQSRLDELNKAIADNESFADKCDDLTASLLRVANYRNKQSIAYYETALRMTEPASVESRPAFEDGKVYILHATDRVGRPTAQLYKVKRVKMFGRNFLAIVDYINRLNKFSIDVERHQIRTSSEGEYVEDVYVYSDGFYHSLYAKDLTDDPTIVKPVDTQTNQPAEDFMTKLNDLSAAVAIAKAEEQKASDAVDAAQKALDAAKDAHNAAIDKANAAIVAFKTFGCEKAKELRGTLLENDIKLFSDAKIIIVNQKGEEIVSPDLSQIFITFYNGVFQVSAGWDNFAIYDTPAEVTDVIERLKAAIACGDNQFSFEVVDDVKELIA